MSRNRGYIAPWTRAEIGARYHIDGQVYVAIRLNDSGYLIWEAPCAECGKPFEVAAKFISHGPSRRCAAHRRPGVKVRLD